MIGKNTKRGWCLCYQTTTPESARLGCVAEHGWLTPRGWKFPLEDQWGYSKNTLADAQDGAFDLGLGEAVRFAQSLGINTATDGGRWFSSVDPDVDYETGAETTYTLHPPRGTTKSTIQRVTRYLKDQQQ